MGFTGGEATLPIYRGYNPIYNWWWGKFLAKVLPSLNFAGEDKQQLTWHFQNTFLFHMIRL